jgi:hypothetical protein
MSEPALDQALDTLDVDEFWARGYAIIHGMYSPEEIEAIRLAAYGSRGYGGDLLANPRLRSVITDGRMVAVARKLLGTSNLFYGGDSSFTINGTQKGFHKDNADRVDPKAPDWESRYTQLRFGIYCQDHSEHTGGLNLRIGSHDLPNTTAGENLYVKTIPGDLAVWSMRITHSGNGMLLKDPGAPYPLPTEHDKFAPEDVAEADGDRIAVFVHIGANDSHANRYCDYTKTRKYLVDAWRKRPYDEETLQAAADTGLFLRNMPAEVMNDPSAGLNELWAPIPYDQPKAPAGVAQPKASGGVAQPKASGGVAQPKASGGVAQPKASGGDALLGQAASTFRRTKRAVRSGVRGLQNGWRAGDPKGL